MGPSQPAPESLREQIRHSFSQLQPPAKPLKTEELGAQVGAPLPKLQNTLQYLEETGELASRTIDADTTIWWPTSDPSSTPQQTAHEEFDAFVNAVQDYAIFMLDTDGTVVTWNKGAERIKGYSESDIVGEHFSTFYTEDDIEAGKPERNLERATEEGRTEDEGWRIRNDDSRFWARVTITAVRNDDGDLQGFTKVTRDMTEQREYKQQLQRERDITNQILATVPVGINVVTGEGVFVRANKRLLDRIDVEEDELGGVSVEDWEIYDTDDEPIPIEEWPWRRVQETGEPVFGFQCQADLAGVGHRWLSINAAPLDGDQSDEELIVISVEDITDQKERERQLRRESEQTEKLLRTAPSLIAVSDADGETIMANERAQEALGLSEEEFIDKPENPDAWTVYCTNGEELAEEEQPAARVLATGEPVFDEELIIETPDGDQMEFRVNAAPVFEEDESIERVIITGEDITELRRRERQLEQRKAELETELSEVFDRISDAFYALDDEWRFTHLNDQATDVLGYSREELLDRELWDVFPEAKESVYWEQFQTAMKTQEPVNFEVRMDELDRWLELNLYPSESGLSVYLQDITERKAYEQQLKESNERLEQFAYAASHDLQEPLRMITSYLSLVERRYSDDLDAEAEEFIEFAVDGAERMREMIDGLLEYSRVETQGDPFEPVDLDDVLADVRENLQLQIEEQDAEISVASMPAVQGDKSQLRQVFQNLVDNAIEYSGDEPPCVHVAAERVGSRWQISVEDNGIGIDPDDADRIFEVFQRLHSREDHEGTGIGLALCRRIIERHGGEIWVEGEPGEGTTFFFTLPEPEDTTT